MRSTAGNASDRRGRIVAGVLCSVFLLLGGGLLVPFVLAPMAKVWQARRWTQQGCTVVSSGVRGGGETYAVDVVYRYAVGGVPYTGTRAQFTGGESSGRDAKQRVVDRLVPGSTVPCWVDPRRPDQSVLDRGLTADMWFGLIPGLFVLLGALGLYGIARGRPAGVSTRPQAEGELPPEAQVGTEPRVLTAEVSPRLRFVAAAVLALFWNGIVQFLVRDVIDGWRYGQRPIFLTVFALPFVATGVGLVVAALRKLLALRNPRPVVTLRPGRLVAGERGELDWELIGAVDRLRRLTFSLEGREQIGAGGEDGKDTSVFARIAISEDDLVATARYGSVRFEVPADSRPSSVSADRKVVWVLKVHGEIPGWPDLQEELPVGVLPPSDREPAGRTVPSSV
jgi:hypothetical protein